MTASHLSTLASLQQQCDKLLTRVQHLEDIEAIRRLRDQYHERVNEDAGDRLWVLFAPDASVVYSGRPEVHEPPAPWVRMAPWLAAAFCTVWALTASLVWPRP